MASWLFILISVFCFAAHSEAIWKLEDNVYIIDSQWTSESLHEIVTLQCNVSENHNTSVYWKKDNEQGRHGVNWEIKVREPIDAGNFTCWSTATNELLSYTTLYVAKENQEGEILERKGPNGNFKCTAKNYSGFFTCSWMIASQSQYESLKFAIISQNTDNTSEGITCEEPIRDSSRRYSVSCKKQRSCQAAEEYEQISMVLHVFDEHLYENDTHNFFIKDILKPDVTECEIARDGKSNVRLTWNPPKTWSTPLSYFELTYQIKIVDSNGRIRHKHEIENSLPLGNRITRACHTKMRSSDTIYIQSRDSYKNGAWSDWSKPCSDKSQKRGKNHLTNNDKTEIVLCKKN